MLGLWKTFRARRAAAAAIVPLVDGTRRRLGAIPDSTWHDPYVIGFLGMLITTIATRTAGSLRTADLAAVQAGAWSDITGKSGDVFGEETSFLSAAHDNAFISGCRDAETLCHALYVASEHSEQQLGAGADSTIAPEHGEIRSALWSRYFDAHLSQPPTAGEI